MINIDSEKINSIVKEYIETAGFRLYDIIYNNVTRILQVFIDHPERNVTIDDCQKISNLIGNGLDAEEIGIGIYTLEVSSPGIHRALRRPEHFQWAVGKLVELDMGSNRIKGYIRKADDEMISIATEDGESVIRYNIITKARIAEEIDYGKRR